jgi:hypothetical protein
MCVFAKPAQQIANELDLISTGLLCFLITRYSPPKRILN